LAEEAAEYIAKSPRSADETHVVAININSDYDWEGKMVCVKREVQDKSIYVWGF
jgi:hypothetical protein